MKQAQCWYICDFPELCEATSPPGVDWPTAKRNAKEAGWTGLQGSNHLCPEHSNPREDN